MSFSIVDKIKARRQPQADVSDDLDLIAFFNEARTDEDRRSVARLVRARSRAGR